jgi:perosamine synthetase
MNLYKKLLNFTPDFPSIRYGIYCGSNTKKELLTIIKLIIKGIFFQNIKKFKYIQKFEKKFAKSTNQRFCLSYGSGRMALYSILKTMKINKGDEIIIPAFTCAVVPNAIIYTGAKPIYIDIDPKNFNINNNLIEKNITNKTIAIYVQHTFGVKCNMSLIFRLAKKYKLKIIEDNAHFYEPKGKKNNYIYASFYSLDHSKIINTHLGGVATTNNTSVYNKLKKDHERLYDLNKFNKIRILLSFLIELILFNKFLLWVGRPVFQILNYLKITFYFRDELSKNKPKYYPCKYNQYLAAIGINQIKNIKKNLKHRVMLSLFFEKKIGWYKFNKNQISKNSWLRYSFLVKNREKFVKIFQKKFNLDIWYTSIFEGRDKNYRDIKYKIGSCPTAEYVAKHIVNFPTHLKVTSQAYEDFFNNNWKWIKNEINYKTLVKKKDMK